MPPTAGVGRRGAGADDDRADQQPTAAADARSSTSIVALVENSRREIGIATCDLEASPTISLCQISDDKFYTKSLSTLGCFNARLLLFCQSSGRGGGGDKASDAAGGLLRTIQRSDDCPLIIEPLSRKYFDEAKGLEIVKDVVLKEDARTIEKEVAPMYLALAATSGAMRINVVQVDGYMLLDSATIANLEVLSNPRTGDEKRCLFGVLNRCRTRAGQRLLRTSLRMPLCDLPSIRARQQCVRAFLSREKLFEETAKVLPHFGDLDAILRALVTPAAAASFGLGASPATVAQGRSATRVQEIATQLIHLFPISFAAALLKLKHVLNLAGDLHAALAHAEESEHESAILKACANQLRRPAIGALLTLIERVVRPEVTAGKASAGPAGLVAVVREGIDTVLDHTRKCWEQS
ncbi:DNA mismatch repair protein MutS, partial [Pavlovales sp. CCMP2436]